MSFAGRVFERGFRTPAFFMRSELAATLWGFKQELLTTTAFSIVINVLMLTPTLYMLQVYDRMLTSRSGFSLLAVTLVMVLFFVMMGVAEWLRSQLLVRVGVRLDLILNSRVFNASFSAHLAETSMSPRQAFTDLTQLRQFLTSQGFFAFVDAPWVPIYIVVLFLLHPALGVLGVVFAALLVWLGWLSHRLSVTPYKEANTASGKVSAYFNSKLRNVEVIEALGMLGSLRDRWRRLQQQYLLRDAFAQDQSSRIQALTKFVRYCQQSMVLGAGAWLVIDGEISPGAMIAANVLMTRALAPVDQVIAGWRGFIGARTAFLRLEELLEAHPPRAVESMAAEPTGKLTLDAVEATAPGRATPILKSISAQFPAGQVVVILGPSGAGKSTLARVMIGIWPVTSGRVLVDEQDIASCAREELGPHLGYLPQDIELFDGTVAENIARFGQLDSEKVIRAAQKAGVHDMILRFPRGYDTPLSEGGGSLSGGQRQRLGLARALYGDPRIVVLDEPNASLDHAGEVALQAAIEDSRKSGKSVFVITHRPALIAIADRVVLLRDGQIVRDGTPREVLASLQAPPETATRLEEPVT